MATRRPYAAFLSYAHRHAAWVAALHRDLESCLSAAGEDRKIFLDQTDLGAGRSWVTRLQQGLDRADQLVLVITPEALASPRVADEWNAFVARRRDWKGRLQLAFLIDAPLPPFLSDVQYVDFREHDGGGYRRGLTELLAGLARQEDRRDLPAVADALEVPRPPGGQVPRKLRAGLVAWLAATLASKPLRPAVEKALGLETLAVDAHPSLECAASAALVEAIGDDDPIPGSLRIAGALVDLFEDAASDLRPLAGDLRELAERRGRGGLFEVWLRSLRDDHSALLPFFGEAAELPLLDDVYVQLELDADGLAEAARAEIAFRAGGESKAKVPPRRATLRELLDLGPDEYPWLTRRWVVRGDPGAGKTTLLRHLAYRLAGEAEPPWVPVFESLPRLMRDREWFLDRFERRLARDGEPARGLAAWLDQQGRGGRLLVLLDGLDEVPRQDLGDAEGLLRRLSARWPEAALVVSSRPIGYRRPAEEFRELQLLPLGRDRQLEFLARWFGRRGGRRVAARAGDALQALEGEASLRELAGNPLYLTLMALLIEDGDAPHRNRPKLYDQVFELLMEGRHRPDPKPIECRDGVRRVLRRLAWGMTLENRDAEPVDVLETRLYQEDFDDLRRVLDRVRRWRRGLRPFLDDVSGLTGILGPHDGRHADWRFWHRTFREALAAEALGERDEAAVLAHAREIAGDESRWAEPFALLTGRVPEPDALVRALVRENRALGLRAIATAQGLRDDTVREVLELSDAWQERAEVYGRIAELVDDPERALALVDRLRRRQRGGNDLYFLFEAGHAIAARWPGAGPSWELLKKRFHKHVPAPPEELFRAVETPLDGTVELWREIPDGRFEMGSPEQEEGRFDDEGPRHLVEILAPFQLAAVPVTNGQYRAFDPEHAWQAWEGVSEEELRHHPVVGVTWYQAVAFCRWLAASFEWARGARLPTEEEWEYACRSGSRSAYWSGGKDADLDRVGWYVENSGKRTHRVGEKAANDWGLYDVHGNVWDWTSSPWSSDYAGRENGLTVDPSFPPAAETPGGTRVIRGGSAWNAARLARSAYRNLRFPEVEMQDPGLSRVAAAGLRCRLPEVVDPGS